MKSKTRELAVFWAGVLIVVLVWRPWSTSPVAMDESSKLAILVGVLLASVGVVVMLATVNVDHGRKALFRLDHFLPFLRKTKKGAVPSTPGILLRVATGRVPQALLSDNKTGKPGLVRRMLRRLGPSVLSSPTRRLVQTSCLLVFLWLFFHICWPYSAAPVPPGKVSTGWRFVEINQSTGNIRLESESPSQWLQAADRPLHLVDSGAAEPSDGYLAAFDLIDGSDLQVVLKPTEPLTAGQLDQLLLSSGSWSLHEDAPGRWPSHYADDLLKKETVPADLFLLLDPLVSVSTAIASRQWVWSLPCAAMILALCVLIPRGFCGYLCPLGTLIDMFDWFVSRRVTRFRVSDGGWWVHVKYYLLLGVLVSAGFGVLLSGLVAAIPVITRGLLFLLARWQTGSMRGWHLMPPISTGHVVSLILFFVVLGLGLLKPRFWCKYVCPTGAMFSLGNVFRVSERKVESSCIHCNQCVEICPFDAIKPDFTTRTTDCTLCQTCGGVCPTQAIKFVERWNGVQLKTEGDRPTNETAIGRRGFLSLSVGTTVGVVGGAVAARATGMAGAGALGQSALPPVRPPGSVPENQFLQMCIRCGQCFKVCPNDVLQAMGFEHGWNALWTPRVQADWAGCEASCNACGQVCPTGAIRALPMEEKRVARMGLAVVDQPTCLPFAGREACQLCVDECRHAGYHAIEFTRVRTLVDQQGAPMEGSGFLAPVVLPEKCVGCGLCQTRCHGINVAHKQTLKVSAIIVQAGPGKEDRITDGSYRQLRRKEGESRAATQRQEPGASDGQYYVPGIENEPPEPSDPFDPFGAGETLDATDPSPMSATQESTFGDQGE